MGARNIAWGIKTPAPHSCADVLKSGNLKLFKTPEPVQASQELLIRVRAYV